MGPVEVVRAAQRAFEAADWAALRALYRDDARAVVAPAEGQVLGPDEVVAAIRAAAQDVIYERPVHEVEEIEPGVVLLVGRVRLRDSDRRGWSDEPRAWVYVVESGAIVRTAVFPGPAAALAAVREHGRSLGLV